MVQNVLKKLTLEGTATFVALGVIILGVISVLLRNVFPGLVQTFGLGMFVLIVGIITLVLVRFVFDIRSLDKATAFFYIVAFIILGVIAYFLMQWVDVGQLFNIDLMNTQASVISTTIQSALKLS